MKNNLLITYDLKMQGKDYETLIDAIKSFPKWARLQGSVWYIKSDLSARQVKEFLSDYIDNNDSLFVAEMKDAAWTASLGNTISEYLIDNWHS